MSSGISSTAGSSTAAFAAASPQDGSKHQNTNKAADTGHQQEQEEGKVLPLPAADPNDTRIPRIQLGETIRFEEWGPIILNTDGKQESFFLY